MGEPVALTCDMQERRLCYTRVSLRDNVPDGGGQQPAVFKTGDGGHTTGRDVAPFPFILG